MAEKYIYLIIGLIVGVVIAYLWVKQKYAAQNATLQSELDRANNNKDVEKLQDQFDKLEELGWKDGIMHFKEAEFQEIKSTLENWYGVKIEVSGAINEDFHYTASYINQSLTEVLQGISFVQKFEYSISGDTVKINFQPI